MISAKLFEDLKPHLQHAEQVWIAVALMKDNALKELQEAIPSDARQSYLVGINLPTPPSVLLTLKEKLSQKFSALIYNQSTTYHPKVYLIKKKIEYIAFVGSANATKGGFLNNIELTVSIVDQNQCVNILNWFSQTFNLGTSITDSFIEKYKIVYERNHFWNSIQRSNLNSILPQPAAPQRLNVLTNQFFRQSDFNAFNPRFHHDISENAKNHRSNVMLGIDSWN